MAPANQTLLNCGHIQEKKNIQLMVLKWSTLTPNQMLQTTSCVNYAAQWDLLLEHCACTGCMTLELPAQLAAEAHGRKAHGGGEEVAWKGQNREIHDTAADETQEWRRDAWHRTQLRRRQPENLRESINWEFHKKRHLVNKLMTKLYLSTCNKECSEYL